AVKPEAGKADLEQLIERADAAAVRREKVLLARARADLPREKAEALTAAMADPTRPQDLRSFDAADGAVLLPVSGPVMVPRDKPEDSKGFSQGLTVTNPPGAVVAAPFDGKIVYAGPFHPYELVLIIRHTDGYHSLLAGLGRADIAVGQWVLAGEPLGVMPDAAEPSFGGEIFFELRRDGGPADPQPWLAQRDDRIGDQRVRE